MGIRFIQVNTKYGIWRSISLFDNEQLIFLLNTIGWHKVLDFPVLFKENVICLYNKISKLEKLLKTLLISRYSSYFIKAYTHIILFLKAPMEKSNYLIQKDTAM